MKDVSPTCGSLQLSEHLFLELLGGSRYLGLDTVGTGIVAIHRDMLVALKQSVHSRVSFAGGGKALICNLPVDDDLHLNRSIAQLQLFLLQLES